jgi:hypothetical protein
MSTFRISYFLTSAYKDGNTPLLLGDNGSLFGDNLPFSGGGRRSAFSGRKNMLFCVFFLRKYLVISEIFCIFAM